jgi:hypothetical protein
MRTERGRFRRAALLSAALFCAHAPAPAYAQPNEPRSTARVHFERGIELANTGEFVDAAEAFEAAYRVSPHYSVLYNLGQAYAVLGRYVEATSTLERFLREGGSSVPAARRSQVAALIASYRNRIGFIVVHVEPRDAELVVDGRSLGAGPRSEPLSLAVGQHVIAATKSEYRPHALAFEVAPGQTSHLTLTLEPLAETRPRPAVLDVRCTVPDATFWIDGERRGITPFSAPILVDAGTRELRFVRAGYRSDVQSVEVVPGGSRRVECRLLPDASLAKRGVPFEVQSEPPATIYVDGLPWREGKLPPGVHDLRVERSGFVPWNQVVRLEPSVPRVVTIKLRPTHEYAARLASQRRSDRVLSAGVGATGLVLLGGATLLYAWNGTRYDEWMTDRRAALQAIAAGGLTSGSLRRWNDLTVRSNDIERTDALALGLGVTGAVALTAAGLIWLASD